MSSLEVGQMAASYGGDLVAVASFESDISVWDIRRATIVSEFKGHIDFGGRRIAISESGQRLATASYRERTLVVYRTIDGAQIWSRRDVGAIDRVSFAPLTGELYASIHGSQSLCLEPESGKVVQTYPGVDGIEQSPFRVDLSAHETARHVKVYSLKERAELFVVAKESFAVLAAVFTPEYLVISESGSSVRCVGIGDGSLVWQYDPPTDYHVVRLAYQYQTDHVVGLLRNYETGKCRRIIVMEGATGQIIGDVPLRDDFVECVLACRGERIVTSDGLIYSIPPAGGPIPIGRISPS